ncbi:MAG: hypothetical protein ACR2F1_15125 [Nitrososphaeraceae archaeon]
MAEKLVHTQTDNKSTSTVQLVKANVTNEEEVYKLVSNIYDKYVFINRK